MTSLTQLMGYNETFHVFHFMLCANHKFILLKIITTAIIK